MYNLLICYLSMLVTSSIKGNNKENLNNRKQAGLKRAKYKVEIELKDDSSDSSSSNFNRNVDELVNYIEKDNIMEAMPLADAFQLETVEIIEKVIPPAFKEVKKVFEEVFVEFNNSLKNEQIIKNETLILDDTSSSIEIIEDDISNKSKQNKNKTKCIESENEIIILDASSSNTEIIHGDNDKLSLLTKGTKNFREGEGMLQEEVNNIQGAIQKQTVKNIENFSKEEHTVNKSNESFCDKFSQFNNGLCNQEHTKNVEDITMLETQNEGFEYVLEQEFVEDFIKQFNEETINEDFENNILKTFENNGSIQDQHYIFETYNAQNSYGPVNESIDEKLRAIREYLDQDFYEEINQEQGFYDNGQLNPNNESDFKSIDENIREILG